MRERHSKKDLAGCTFLANYGQSCAKEGCWAKRLKDSSLLNERSEYTPEKRAEMRREIEEAASEAGCPNFPPADET